MFGWGMGHSCHIHSVAADDHVFRRVLWVALLLNASMFLIEVFSGMAAGSVSLMADAIDFLADAFNYGISLYVMHRSLRMRAMAALFKAGCMLVLGIGILALALYRAWDGGVPDHTTMGMVGALAFVANLICSVLLYRFRGGDSNRQSVWICSRNDTIGNLLVIAAAGGVFATLTRWPDLAIASIMALLAISGAWRIIAQAQGELREANGHNGDDGDDCAHYTSDGDDNHDHAPN